MPDDTDKQIEVLRRMTPEQKLEAAFRLNREARRLKAAWLRQQHPDWSEDEINKTVREIFLYART